MSSSRRLKERHKRSNGDEDESAARTRPLTFEEIMVKRKRKSLSEDLKDRVLKPEIVPRDGDAKNVSQNIKSERGYRQNKDSSFIDEQRAAEKERSISSGKIEKGTFVNTKSDRDGPGIGRKLKSVISRPSNDVSDEIRGSRNDKQVHDKRDNDKRSMDYKKGSWESRGRESLTERSRVNSERESKRKYQNEVADNDKNKERNVSKKLDAKRRYEAKVPERSRRNELSKSRFEEPKIRRGRSRSRSRSEDRDDRHRRSRSPSRRAHNKSSSHNRTAEREVSPQPTKDRPQKQNPKLSSNGSNSHYRRHDEPKSGLGGYSPRKRISEAAAKTPPPPDHLSSDKKSAKWDILPPGPVKMLSGSVSSNVQSLNRIVPTVVQESASTPHVNSAYAKLQSLKILASVDSVQLTQATRPMRRLYVDNVPSTTSDKALVKWFNDLFLSLGVNHVPGTEPCINCIINNDKAQALVEFLTPQDASTALSFDGGLISGSTLKIRRPKDFVEVATGDLEKSVAAVEKSVAAVDEVSDVVKDSPHKIFIGGISKALSSKMLMEIVSAFGPLKSYHFEVNGNLDEPCAFLEYVDRSITPKACAGLSGMKFDGKVLTVVQALLSTESLGNTESSPSYEIPEHAKPLLKQPTQVLKLKNMFNVESLSTLSESEVEEVVEDIRLECARFGNVKSVNVIKQGNHLNNEAQTTDLEKNLGCENICVKTENVERHMNDESNGIEPEKFVGSTDELQVNKVEKDMGNGFDKPDSVTANKLPQPSQHNGPKQMAEHDYYEKSEENQTLGDTNSSEQGFVDELGFNLKSEPSSMEKQGGTKWDLDLERMFEVGSVFVEFGRPEAACTAAHCLHGRVYDNRIVSVDYVSLDYYTSRFPK